MVLFKSPRSTVAANAKHGTGQPKACSSPSPVFNATKDFADDPGRIKNPGEDCRNPPSDMADLTADADFPLFQVALPNLRDVTVQSLWSRLLEISY